MKHWEKHAHVISVLCDVSAQGAIISNTEDVVEIKTLKVIDTFISLILDE